MGKAGLLGECVLQKRFKGIEQEWQCGIRKELLRMRKEQYLILAIGIIGLLAFAGPMILKGIVNIGSLTGTLVFVMVIIYGLFIRQIHVWIKHRWQGGGKVFLLAVGIICAALICTACVETVLMIRAANNRPPANTTAVVLGCSVKGTSPSRVLQERLDAAYTYLQENPEAVCILSGGQGEGEDITEARCMWNYLTEKGISSERLFLEEKSTTTIENLEFTKEIIQREGLSEDIAIITSEFHTYRASLIAEDLELNSYSVPGRTFWVLLPIYYVRELYGILYQWAL